MEMKPTYFMRQGKRFKVNNNRSLYNHNFRSESLKTHCPNAEEDAKQYPKVLKKLQGVQIKCAELLIKHGCHVDDLTEAHEEDHPRSALYFAVESNSYDLAAFLLKSTTTIEGKDSSDHNILHQAAFHFAFYKD